MRIIPNFLPHLKRWVGGKVTVASTKKDQVPKSRGNGVYEVTQYAIDINNMPHGVLTVKRDNWSTVSMQYKGYIPGIPDEQPSRNYVLAATRAGSSRKLERSDGFDEVEFP